MSDRAAELRERMVTALEQQGHPRAETLAAFGRVPRHLFLPGVDLDRVYSDVAIPTRSGEQGLPTSSSSQPAIMAVMADALDLDRGQRVLEIGAGTGYNAAILAELVGPDNVVTVDIDADVCDEARAHLASAGYGEVRVATADGWEGWPGAAPYDRIELTASTADISPAWVDQLREQGLLVAPVLFRPNAQAVVAFRKNDRTLESTMISAGGFMTLQGQGAPAPLFVDAGNWRVCAASAIDPQRVAELLGAEPRLDHIADVSWRELALLPLLEPRSVLVTPRDGRSHYVGIVTDDGDGVAFIDPIPLLMPRFTIVAFGARRAEAQLRDALARTRATNWSRIHVTAVPSGVPVHGDVLFVREHYTFVVERAA